MDGKDCLESIVYRRIGRNVPAILRVYIKENRSSENVAVINAIYQCKKYLSIYEKFQESRVVVTTHARLVMLNEDIINSYIVIIDEDILSTFFKNFHTVPLEDIKKVTAARDCPEMLRARLEEILAAPEGQYTRFNTDSTYQHLTEEELDKLMLHADINDIAFAKTYYVDGENVDYFCPQSMVLGKYIVLSATADTEMYRKYFPGWRVEDYPYKKAKYKSVLKQMTASTMSRQYIHNHKKEIIQYLEKFRDTHKRITFMKYEEELNGSGLHFGNAEGTDILNGENVIVIGTPHMSEFVYKLLGCFLGMDVNEDILAERKVRYNGYEFIFMTYSDINLRSLQLYFIKKELEQCIGRARLLRNECEVLVLSNFPCEQAELIQADSTVKAGI